MTLYTDPTRDDCQLGGKRVTYAKLQRDYRCNECGGRIVVRPVVLVSSYIWYPACGRCQSADFVHECELDRQKADAVEVLDGLPADLVARLTQKGDAETCLSQD